VYKPLKEFIDIISFQHILGTIVMAVLVAHFVYRNNMKARVAVACTNFRKDFTTELKDIYPLVGIWPSDIDAFLRGRFSNLQVAIENFRPFVPWYKRWLFDKAWFRYRSATGRKVDIQCYLHYESFDSNPEYRDVFHQNVRKILSFANKT
jgi:hypothetical protein